MTSVGAVSVASESGGRVATSTNEPCPKGLGLRAQFAEAGENPRVLLTAALSYAQRGWRVFPVVPRRKAPPMTEKGCHDGTTDIPTILRWWSDNPDANIGIATGTQSKLVVVDLDVYKVKDAALAFEKDHHAPKTYTVATPRGGRHLYFELGSRQQARCTAEVSGVCVKANGGYVIAPPSSTTDGQYSVIDPRKPAKAPASLCLPLPATQRQTNPTSATLHRPPQTTEQCSERMTSDDSDDSEQSIAEIALAHVSAGAHQNNRALFDLARDLKRFELKHGVLTAADKAESFSVWFEESHNRGVLRADQSRDDYFTEYLWACSCAIFPKGSGAITALFERAQKEPFPSESNYFEDDNKRLLVALCYQLHLTANRGVWFLSGRTGARLVLGDPGRQTTVSQWLREFAALGILQVTQQHTAAKARRYRYIEQPPVTQGKIQTK